MTRRYRRILLTGAAGRLGTQLRRGLAPLAETLRVVDRVGLENLGPNEEMQVFDLADPAATMAACEGCDAVVHMGAAAAELPWQEILDSSIRGTYHLYEGARRHGVRRVVYASSNHAVGFHGLDRQIGTDCALRPDSLYGVSKCFGEALASLYWDKFGIESACVRIFSCFPEPENRRMLWSWLSYDDCIRLFAACLTAPHVGHTITFGVSDNRVKPVDNTKAGHLGYVAQDTAEPWRAALEARTEAPDPMALATRVIGGWYAEKPHPEDMPAGA